VLGHTASRIFGKYFDRTTAATLASLPVDGISRKAPYSELLKAWKVPSPKNSSRDGHGLSEKFSLSCLASKVFFLSFQLWAAISIYGGITQGRCKIFFRWHGMVFSGLALSYFHRCLQILSDQILAGV
jgi:hypothetical protein